VNAQVFSERLLRESALLAIDTEVPLHTLLEVAFHRVEARGPLLVGLPTHEYHRRGMRTVALIALALVVGCGGGDSRSADPQLTALHPEAYDFTREADDCRALLEWHDGAVRLVNNDTRLLDVTTTFSTLPIDSVSRSLADVDASEVRLAQLDCPDAPVQITTLKQRTCDRLQAAFERAGLTGRAIEFVRAANDQMDAIGCYAE
jgi:hypothetical protein